MRPNVIIGWHSPRLALWTVFIENQASSVGWIILLGVLRWLFWCLPFYAADDHGWGVRLLAFYLSVIRGPYQCVICGRATTNGADLKHGIPAYCSRKACFIEARP